MLSLAVARADTVAVGGLFQRKGEPPGTFRMGSATEAAERVAFIRELAGAQAAELELHVLIQGVVITDNRRAAARELVEKQVPHFTVDELLETPFVLIGTVDEIAAQVRERRERYGFSFITVHEPYMEAFGQVIGRLRAAGASA
jgi:alkanesulfonate monooxygenase SsuD/methylene tetrahydromethanopterin reductase-like flavin-dependent oxidoreductase (luciferase family)